MASTEVKLGGAWAAFEQQQVDREAVIDKLCSQVGFHAVLRLSWQVTGVEFAPAC